MNWYKLATEGLPDGPSTDSPEEWSPPLELEHPEEPDFDRDDPLSMVPQIIRDFERGQNIEGLEGMQPPEPPAKSAAAVAPVLSRSQMRFKTRNFRHTNFKKCWSSIHDNKFKAFARQTFDKMISTPGSVPLKRLDSSRGGGVEVYSVKIGNSHRALAVKIRSAFVWFWIGRHEEYHSEITGPRLTQTTRNISWPPNPHAK